jgi:hypothetical protein
VLPLNCCNATARQARSRGSVETKRAARGRRETASRRNAGRAARLAYCGRVTLCSHSDGNEPASGGKPCYRPPIVVWEARPAWIIAKTKALTESGSFAHLVVSGSPEASPKRNLRCFPSNFTRVCDPLGTRTLTKATRRIHIRSVHFHENRGGRPCAGGDIIGELLCRQQAVNSRFYFRACSWPVSAPRGRAPWKRGGRWKSQSLRSARATLP